MTRNILRKDIKKSHQGQKQVRVDEEEGYYYVAHLKTLATDKVTGEYIIADKGEDYVEFNENDREVKGRGYTVEDGKIKLKANVDEKNKIYEYYTISSVKHITYYDLDGNELVKAEVGKNGQMTFDIDNRFNSLAEEGLSTAIKNFKNKVKAVLNYSNFPSVDAFDDTLSQLEYSLLQLKNYQKGKKNIIIDTTCTNIEDENNDTNINYIAKKLIESLENPEQIRICDFGYSIYENNNNIGGHTVQMSISKGRLIMMNTGGGGEYNNVLLKKIEEAFIKKCKEEAEKTDDINEKEKYLEYKDKLEISEFKGVEQDRGNCVMVSKLYAVTLLSDNRYNSKKLIKAISRSENIVRIVNERGGVDKLTYEELSRLKESDVELLNKFVTGVNEDVKNNNSKIELREECIRYNNLLNKIKDIDNAIKLKKNFVRGIKPKAILTDKDKEVIQEANKNIDRNKGNINKQIITKIKEKAEAEGVDADQKMQYYLTAIKLGDKESIEEYFEALELKDDVESEIEILNNLLNDDLLENKSKDSGEYIKNVIRKFEDKIKDLEKTRIKTALKEKSINSIEDYLKKMEEIFKKKEEDLNEDDKSKINDFNKQFSKGIINTTMQNTKTAQSPSSMSLKCLIADFFENEYPNLAWNVLIDSVILEHIRHLKSTERLFSTIMNNKELMEVLINYNYEDEDDLGHGFCWDALMDSIANGDNLQVLDNDIIRDNIPNLIAYGKYFNKEKENIRKDFIKNLTSKITAIDINSIQKAKITPRKNLPDKVKLESINLEEKKSLSINLLTGAVANNNKELFDNLIGQIEKFGEEKAKLTSDNYYTILKESIENGETVDLEIYQKLLENCKDLPDKEKKLEVIYNTIIEKSKENETLVGAEKGKINVDLLTLLVKNEAKLDFSKLSNSQKEYLLKYFHENPDKYRELKENVINNLLKNEYEIEKYSKSEGEKKIKYRTFYKSNDDKIEKISTFDCEVMEKAAIQTVDADENEEEEEESKEEKKTYNIYKINYSPNGEKDIEYYKAKEDSVAVNIKLDKSNKIKDFKGNNITEDDIENIIQNGSRDDFNLSNLVYFQLLGKFGDEAINVINGIEENLNIIGSFFDAKKDNFGLKESAVEIVNKLENFDDFVAFIEKSKLLKSIAEKGGGNISSLEECSKVNDIMNNFKELYGENNSKLESISLTIEERKEAIEEEKRKAEEEKANHNTKEAKSTIPEKEKEQIQKQIKTNKENYREKYEENKKNGEIKNFRDKKNELNKELLRGYEENDDRDDILKKLLELRESKVLLQKNIERITKVEKEIEIKNEQEAKVLVEDYNGSLSKQGSISNKDAAAMVNNIMEAQKEYDVLGDKKFQDMTIKPITTANGKTYNGYGGIIDYYDDGEMKIRFTEDGFIADQLKQMFPNNDAVEKVFENGEIVFNGVSKEDAIRFVSEFKINPINAYLNFCNNKNVSSITGNIDNNEIKKLLNVATDCRRIIGEISDISENIEESENPYKELVKSIKNYATEILMNPNGDKYKEIINNKDITIKEPVYVARQLLKVAKAVDESLNISEEDKRKQKNKELLEEINKNIGAEDDIVKKLVTCINTSHHLNLKRAGLDIGAKRSADKNATDTPEFADNMVFL